MGKRFYYLDAAGAVLLINMIVKHCCEWSRTYPVYIQLAFVLNFFMPWFFFKAGMFFRNRSVREEIHKGFRRLMIPFIVFSVIGTAVLWLKMILFDEFSLRSVLLTAASLVRIGSVPGNMALWFLLSLFCVRVIFCFLHHRIHASDRGAGRYVWVGVLVVACCVFIPVHYLLYLKSVRYPYYIFNISSGLLFYSAGYLLRDFRPGLWATVGLLALYSALMYLAPVVLDMRTGDLESGSFLMWVPCSLAGILTINALAGNFLDRANLLSRIGAETMPYYCMNWCVIILVSMFFVSDSDKPDIPYLVTLLAANAVLLPSFTYLIGRSRYSYIIK